MRVLLSTSTLPLRPDDGLPAFVAELAQELAADCQVAVLAPGAPGQPGRERWGAVEVFRFSYFFPRRWQRLAYGRGISHNLRADWLARVQPPSFVAAQALALRRLAAQWRPEVVNAHWIVPQGLTAAAVRGRPRRFAHVLTLHGGDVHLLARLPGARRLARYTVGRCDGLLAVSRELRERLDRVLGSASGAVIQPVGVDLGRFGKPPGPAPEAARFPDGYLAFVGRLVEIKGVDLLLRALPTLREPWPGLGCVLVGEGPEEPRLRSLVAELGLGPAVVFAGRRGRAEVARTLAGARAAVLPSRVGPRGRAEGLPAVLLEALAAGVPVVASATGGIPELLRAGENGWLVPAGQVAALAQAILEVLDSPRRAARVAAGRETAARYAWPRVAGRYRAVFESALAAGTTR